MHDDTDSTSGDDQGNGGDDATEATPTEAGGPTTEVEVEGDGTTVNVETEAGAEPEPEGDEA
jgi:hypothetical protein